MNHDTSGMVTKDFFERHTVVVAKKLIGSYLVRRRGTKKYRYRIIETEAYLGEEDLASHARFGKTARSEIMFGHPGVFYVYLIYGMHWMLNVVTESHGHAGAVLIRGIETMDGEKILGPGKITRLLQINKSLNGKTAASENGVWFEKSHTNILPKHILCTKRIGVEYAGEWASKKYRFLLKP
jgi:DNA-3-methyladenine glycosylase